jgi:hypothetical protein
MLPISRMFCAHTGGVVALLQSNRSETALDLGGPDATSLHLALSDLLQHVPGHVSMRTTVHSSDSVRLLHAVKALEQNLV